MLEASGVAGKFEADEHRAGITVFAPTDDAFAGLPAGDCLQFLPAERKAVMLLYHVSTCSTHTTRWGSWNRS